MIAIGQHKWIFASGGTCGNNLYSYQDFYGIRPVNNVSFGAKHQILIRSNKEYIWIGADWRDLVFI